MMGYVWRRRETPRNMVRPPQKVGGGFGFSFKSARIVREQQPMTGLSKGRLHPIAQTNQFLMFVNRIVKIQTSGSANLLIGAGESANQEIGAPRINRRSRFRFGSSGGIFH